MAHQRSKRMSVRVALVCAGAMLASSLGATGGVSAAEASCSTYAQPHYWSTGFYTIAGGRCTENQHKIAVSGHVTGGGRWYEISEECHGTRNCLDVSPNLKNPPGRQRWKISVVVGYKTHWYSVPAKYVVRNYYFYF